MVSFKSLLHDSGYTAETFTATYNNVYPSSPISLSTVQSWSAGRRSFKRSSAIVVQRVAHIIDDPDSSPLDYERRSHLVFTLLNVIG